MSRDDDLIFNWGIAGVLLAIASAFCGQVGILPVRIAFWGLYSGLIFSFLLLAFLVARNIARDR
jgi:hypothetical protein